MADDTARAAFAEWRLSVSTPNGGMFVTPYDVERFDALLASTEAEPPPEPTSTLARAWDEGHKHRWRRGPDNCQCSAWSSSECGCGEYGNGELLSLNDNPYAAAHRTRELTGDDS